MKITPILSPDNSETLILELIDAANSSLAIEQMYYYSDLTLFTTAILNAKTRGVNVSLILDDGNDESDIVVTELQAANVEVKVSDGTVPIYFNTQHNKGIIVDKKIVMACN